MAAKRERESIDYQQLNSFSSVVLYGETKRRKGKLYEADRLIEKRNKGRNEDYLVQWKGWPIESSSWEPSENLNSVLLRSYSRPLTPSNDLLLDASREFAVAVTSCLKSSSFSPQYIPMRLDVWRYVVYQRGRESNHRGHLMLEKGDFNKLKFLPNNWWYYLNENGEGKAVDFPIKVKPVLSWSPLTFMIDKGNELCKAPRMPLEKLKLYVLKRPCNVNNLL